ncbi:MAG: Chitinase [Fibrobacteres bacterium]|nr:Chitinase [Fibrobacterota bacterium]
MGRNGQSDFQVIGYLYTGESSEVDRIQYDKLTHVNYSFAIPAADGGLTGVDETILARLVEKAHASGVKVGVAVGGWNDGDTSNFEALAASPTARNRFIANLVALTDRFNVDGIDMDWEYPKLESVQDFTILMRDLSAALRAKGKSLTLAVIAKDDQHGQFIRAEVFGYIDFLNIMAYDWHYDRDGGVPHSSYELAEESLDYWLQRGCPKEKAILGVPFYGRTPPTKYKELIAKDPAAAGVDAQGPVYYNGQPTMRRKTELAYRKGGGIMFWEISQDTADGTSLLGAIHEKAQSLL